MASNGPSWDSQRKQNRFDETGSFIVPLKDGKIISVSSTKYDWCDSFNDRGWAKVVKSGLSGKINIKGEVISLFDENLTGHMTLVSDTLLFIKMGGGEL